MVGLLILVADRALAVQGVSEAGPGSECMRRSGCSAWSSRLWSARWRRGAAFAWLAVIRDAMMFGDFKLLYGFVAIFVVVLVGQSCNRTSFKLGFALSAHCPQRPCLEPAGHGARRLGQRAARRLPAAGSSSWPAQGNGDSAVTVFGMIVGAALAHNFGLAGNPRQQERGRSARGRRHLHCGQGRRDRRPGRAAGDRPVEYAQKGGSEMIDARGYSCPMPVVMVQNEVRRRTRPTRSRCWWTARPAWRTSPASARSRATPCPARVRSGDFRLTLRK